MHLEFTKMNGAGNDFVVIDNRDLSLQLTKPQIAQLCDRHRGVGADGLLAVEPAAESNADFRMRYYNADGGEAEMCGNGARCFARFANRLLDTTKDSLAFETPAGLIGARFHGDHVEISMSLPHSEAPAENLTVADQSLLVSFINTGVPHAVSFVDDLAGTDIRQLGAALRHHPRFAPAGTNVNFAHASSADHIAIRTYERGVEDETLACGTGVVASALIQHRRSGTPSPIRVTVQGGDTLEVSFDLDGNQFINVHLTGPADFVFDGVTGI